MNLIQKAIIENEKNIYQTLPHSQAALNEIEDCMIKEGFPILIMMKLYNEYRAENEAHKKEQEKIYGGKFNEEIALKRGSKMFEKIIKKHINQLNKYASKWDNRSFAISQANLLLKILQAKQSCPDEQIKEALNNTKNYAESIWKSEQETDEDVFKTISNINNCALAY